MCAHGRGRGSGAIFSRKKGTEIFIRFLRAVLKSCLLNPSYRPRDDKEERGVPDTYSQMIMSFTSLAPAPATLRARALDSDPNKWAHTLWHSTVRHSNGQMPLKWVSLIKLSTSTCKLTMHMSCRSDTCRYGSVRTVD